MGSLGQSLREAREDRGISLEDVSKATKIRIEYLVALEGDDFIRLPDDVFSRGFVRAYAEVVGLDPEAAVAAGAAERRARGSEAGETTDVLAELNRLIPDKASATERRSSRRRLLVGAGAIGVAVVVGLASWWIVGRDSREPIARAAAPVHRDSVAAPPAVPRPTPPRAVEEPVHEAAAPARPTEPVGIPSLSVPDSAVGRGVVNRRVVDRSDSFDEGQTVWFWTQVEGARPHGDRIRHVWLHAGQEVHTMDLELGGPTWRTQSAKRMRPGSQGNWRVEARDAAGHVLAASDFVCR